MNKHECCFKLVYMGENFTRQRSLCLGLIPLGKEVIRMICTNSYAAEALKTITNQGLVYNKKEPIAYVFEVEFPFLHDSTEGVYL